MPAKNTVCISYHKYIYIYIYIFIYLFIYLYVALANLSCSLPEQQLCRLTLQQKARKLSSRTHLFLEKQNTATGVRSFLVNSCIISNRPCRSPPVFGPELRPMAVCVCVCVCLCVCVCVCQCVRSVPPVFGPELRPMAVCVCVFVCVSVCVLCHPCLGLSCVP